MFRCRLTYPAPSVGNRGDGHVSHWFERDEGLVWRDDFDAIIRGDDTAGEHDAHDPGFAHERAALEHRGHEAGRKRVELRAWVAQSRDLDDGDRTEVDARAAGPAE